MLFAIPVLAVLGATMMLQMGCCNTILQAVVEDDKRGRVMSLFTMAFMGTVPLGSLVAGASQITSVSKRCCFHALRIVWWWHVSLLNRCRD